MELIKVKKVCYKIYITITIKLRDKITIKKRRKRKIKKKKQKINKMNNKKIRKFKLLNNSLKVMMVIIMNRIPKKGQNKCKMI